MQLRVARTRYYHTRDESLTFSLSKYHENIAYEKCTLKVGGKEGANTVKRKVISMYLRGYNIIHIKPEGERFLPKQRDAVRELVNRNLIGAEIIED